MERKEDQVSTLFFFFFKYGYHSEYMSIMQCTQCSFRIIHLTCFQVIQEQLLRGIIQKNYTALSVSRCVI